MNLVECCASYAADASSTVKQHTTQTQHKHSINSQTNKYASKTKHAKIINSTKINNFSI